MCFRQDSAAGRLKPGISRLSEPRPVHCAMFAVDIVSFTRRDPDLQVYLRDALYQIVQNSCDAADVCWDDCHHEDRGDGILVIARTDVSIAVLLDSLVAQIRTKLRKHNKTANAQAQIRLRMAIHAGYVHLDAHGASGRAVNHLFRLLEAPVLKVAFADHLGDFALIVSDHLYEEVVRYGPGLIDPRSFQRIPVEVKETSGRGWIWLSPPARPPGRHATPATASTHHKVELTPYELQITLLMTMACLCSLVDR
jgi:class 3 adenylate cyclase